MKKIVIIVWSVFMLISLSACSDEMASNMIEKGLEKATGIDEADVHIDHGDTSRFDKSLKGLDLLKSIKLIPENLNMDYKLSAETRMPVVGVVSKVKVFKRGESYRKEVEEDERYTISIYNADEDKTYTWQKTEKSGSVYSGKVGEFSHFEDFSFNHSALTEDGTDIADQNYENLLETLEAGGITNNAEIITRYGGDVLKISLSGEDDDDDISGEIALYMSLNYALPIEASAEVNGAKIFTHIVTNFTVNPSNDSKLFKRPSDIEFN